MGGIPEIVQDGIDGFLVEPNSPKAIAEGIQRAVSSEDALDELVKNGRESYETRFTLERYHERLLGLIADVAGQPSPQHDSGENRQY